MTKRFVCGLDARSVAAYNDETRNAELIDVHTFAVAIVSALH